jgi:hypothetical protein
MSLAVVSTTFYYFFVHLEMVYFYHHFNSFELFIWQTILLFCAVGAWAEDLVAQEQYR